MTTHHDAILVGGPQDGTPVSAGDTGLLEIEIDGFIHRYIRTTAHRQHDGQELLVYNYDGEVAPGGGEPGVENPADRVASPAADQG